MMIGRKIESQITKRLDDERAIILIGPRQTGKTTFFRDLMKGREDVVYFNCDNGFIQNIFEDINRGNFRQIFGDNKYIVIDEAQRIKNIGIAIKIMTDELQDKKILVTGSSSLDLANSINEPLTGRKWEFHLYPISWPEYVSYRGWLEAREDLENRLIFGMYPTVITHRGDEISRLDELSGSYLYRDLLHFPHARKPELLRRLLQALALQVGNEVSWNELSQLLTVDAKTIRHYIDLLEKAYIIFELNPWSRNPRKEISSSRKIYFYDNGILNSIINTYKPISLRRDIGALWENFLISERQKSLAYSGSYARTWFWRSKGGSEIDHIEEKDGHLTATEIKWNPKKQRRPLKLFTEFYPDSEFQTIHRDNFNDWLHRP